jgi:hypothetical protein
MYVTVIVRDSIDFIPIQLPAPHRYVTTRLDYDSKVSLGRLSHTALTSSSNGYVCMNINVRVFARISCIALAVTVRRS